MNDRGGNHNQFHPFGSDFSNFGASVNKTEANDANRVENHSYSQSIGGNHNPFESKTNPIGNGSSFLGTNNNASGNYFTASFNRQLDARRDHSGANKSFFTEGPNHYGTNNNNQFDGIHVPMGTNNNNQFGRMNNPFGTNNNHLSLNTNYFGSNTGGKPEDFYGSRSILTDKVSSLSGIVNTHNGMATNVMFSNKESMPAPKGRPPTHLRPIKSNGKRDREEAFKLETLRCELPYLTRQQTSEYRHSFYHNLCLGILKDGYHRTFSELFHLIRQQENARQKAGPDSTLWNQTPLNQQPEKLLKMRDTLCSAEEAEREGDLLRVYDSYLVLATYFRTQPEDRWLMDHYYSYCLVNAARIENDDNRKLAEAHLNMGTCVENNGDIQGALKHFETFYTLSLDKEWMDEEENSLHSRACEHLARVHTALAEQPSLTEAKDRVQFLKTAHSMAKESCNRKLEGQCGYRLGLGYENVGKPDTALLFLRSFYESSKSINDDENLGFACEAMAKAYERQNKIAESIRFLEEFVEVTSRSGQNQLYSRACRDLGAVFNRLGRYDESAEYFNRAFATARTLNDVGAAHDARLQFGIAIGHGVLPNFNSYVDKATKCSLKKSLDWKNSRGDIKKIFTEELPDAKVCTLESRRPTRKVLQLQ